MDAKNFALPVLALVGMCGYWLWRSSGDPAATPIAVAEKPSASREGARGRDPSDAASKPGESKPTASEATRPATAPIEPPQTTERDRAKTDALRLQLRTLERSGGSGKRSDVEREAEDDPPGTLDKDYIRARIKDDLVPIAQECYESALEDDPKLAGRLTMKFSIVGDEDVGGVVDEADIDPSSDIKHPALTECMRESMLSLSFAPPEGGGTVQVTYPFIFEPDDGAPAGEK